MDNLSHSVAGLAAGELIHRSLPDETRADDQRLRHRLLLVACWLASNFPDLDLILTPLLPQPLGYLLHHRGHTHTILYAIPQALLLCGLLWLFWPAARRLLKASATARKGLAAALAAGFALHLAMDYLNPYGIHPFHPFDSRWFYGDMVFILEPIFWIALGIPLAMMVRRAWLKWPLALLLIGLPAYFMLRGYLAWGSFALLFAIAIGLGVLQHRAGARGRQALLSAAMIVTSFVGMQAIASGHAKHVIAQALGKMDGASVVRDISMSSFPSHPLCWMFVSLESNEASDSYRLRHGTLSLAPGLAARDCPAKLSGLDAEAGDAAIVFRAQATGSLSQLRALQANNCHVKAWLRFARMPLISQTEATDVRFMVSPRGNFTTMRFADFAGRECARHIPQWEFPRADLLDAQP